MKESTLGYVILTFGCWLLGLVFFYNWRRQVTIRDKSSVKTEGIVIDYKMFQLVHTPIVVYYVNGVKYKTYLRYYMRDVDRSNVYFAYETEEELKREMLQDRFIIYANRINYNYKKYWPIGLLARLWQFTITPKILNWPMLSGMQERYIISVI